MSDAPAPPSTPLVTRRLTDSSADLAVAAAMLRAGGLVAFPTETVYGLGADATQAEAVAGIYAAKERPRFNPLIAHVPDLAAAERLGHFGPQARILAERFWPGPLTLVVPRLGEGGVCDLATAGLDSVALRVPDHPVARALLAAAGVPVAAPSANRSGRISPTEAAHVLEDLDSRINAVVDGGPTRVGVESTIVSCLEDPPVLLRPGGVPRAALEAVLGVALAEPAGDDDRDAPLAPGMLASHYAPRAAVRLDATRIEPGEAALLFGPFQPEGLELAVAVESLSEAASLPEAAARLFAALRRLDATGATTIAVAPVSGDGRGEAIRDRLARAAAPR